MENKRIFNVNELAKYLGVSEQLIYKMKREQKLPHFRVGRRILFDKNKIDLWIENISLKQEE